MVAMVVVTVTVVVVLALAISLRYRAVPVQCQADPVGLGDSEEDLLTHLYDEAFYTDLGYLTVLALHNVNEESK